jgi:hypothetical protein
MMFVPHRKHTYGPPRLDGNGLNFLYVDDVLTSQETHLLSSTAGYGDGFTSLYLDDVTASQETPMAFHGLLRKWL